MAGIVPGLPDYSLSRIDPVICNYNGGTALKSHAWAIFLTFLYVPAERLQV